MLLKRILSAALAAAAILAFAGCGKSSDSSAKAESSQTETQQQTTDQTTTAKPATTNASADKTAEKPVPGKLYALNQYEGDAPAISALKLNGNQVGTEEGVNGWKASADKIRFVFEQSEWIELYPQTEPTSGLAAYLVPHSDDAATYTDTFVAALNDDVPKTELTKPAEQGAAWGSFYAHPEVNAPGYYDLIITSGMKPVAMVMVRIYPEGGLSDYDDAKLEQLMNNESSAAIQ